MNEVYVIAGGEWLRNNLNAIAAFMGTRTWDSIEKIALTLSVLAVAVMWVQRHNVMDLLGWVAVFVLISLLVNVRTSVQIIDNSDLVKIHRVDNVPVGLAMPLSLTTRIGHAMVASYEMIFTQPDSVTYSKTGMLFGAELVSKSTDFLSRNPEIANLFQDYVQNCVMGDIYLNHKYTLEELMASADPYTLIFSRPSPLRGVYDSNNNFVTCKDASVSLKDKLNLDTQSGGKTWHYYAQQLFGGRPDPNLLFSTLIGDSYSYFYGSSKSASQIIRQNVTINALKEGITSYAARNGDSASLVNLATTSSMEKQRLAHVSIGHAAHDADHPDGDRHRYFPAPGTGGCLQQTDAVRPERLCVCPDVVAVMANVVRHSEQRHDILCEAEWCTGGALGNFTDTAEILRSGFHCRVSFHDDPAIILDDGQGARGRIFQCVQPFRFLCYQPDRQCSRQCG